MALENNVATCVFTVKLYDKIHQAELCVCLCSVFNVDEESHSERPTHFYSISFLKLQAPGRCFCMHPQPIESKKL